MLAADDIESLTHELKFGIAASRRNSVETLLHHHCEPDPLYPSGIVTSIYYDTPELHYLRQKVDSDYLKTKVRLRWYSDLDGDYGDDGVFMEAKFRIGTRRRKFRQPTTLKGSWLAQQSLSRPKLISLPTHLRKDGLRIQQPLLPFMTVRYRRQRFFDPYSKARVSLDTTISAGPLNPFFARVWTPRPLRLAIVEVKGHLRRLPHGLRYLTDLGCYRMSFSKYTACFEAAAGTQP